MTNTIRQARLHGPGDMRIDAVPFPEMQDEDVLIEVAACGICGSDLGFHRNGGIRPDREPMAMGHEFSGVISAVGPRVERFAPGMRVVVNPMANGAMIGCGSDDGAFARTIRVRNVNRAPVLHEVAAHVPMDVAALAEPLAVSLHAVNRSRAVDGETALVLGAGAIGLGIVAMLKQRGVAQVAVADLSARRLAIAATLGADLVINPARDDVWETLARAHGTVPTFLGTRARATQLIFENTGVPSVLQDAVAHARDTARITVASVFKEPILFDFTMLQVKEIELIGTMCYPGEFPDAVAWLASRTADAAAMISHRFALDDIDMAFQTAADANASAKVMIVPGAERIR